MNNYSNVSSTTGKPSGVKGYDYGDDYIIIYFTSGAKYTYTHSSCGSNHINNMKQLADAQRGLNTYVTRHKPPFSSKN